MEIKCCTCGRVLDESYFSLDTTHITGHARKCKRCHSAYAKAHYLKNREKALERQKARYAADPSVHLRYLREWRKTRAGKESHYRDTLEQRRKFPSKYQAYLVVQRALRAKTLIKQPCIICGEVRRVHAHHDDYTKPLDVIWLCRKHHQERHNRVRASPVP